MTGSHHFLWFLGPSEKNYFLDHPVVFTIYICDSILSKKKTNTGHHFHFFLQPILIPMTASLLPGSWVKVAVVIAAVFIISTIWLLQLDTSVRSVACLLFIRSCQWTGPRWRGWGGVCLGAVRARRGREKKKMRWEVWKRSVCMSTISHSPLSPPWAGDYSEVSTPPPCLRRTVMLDRWGIELMCSILRPDMDVLEYGSGGSTTFLRF